MSIKKIGDIEYMVFNDCTLIDRGFDSKWGKRREALRRVKYLIKNYLNEWRKEENVRFRSEDDKYLWKILATELSFKKLKTIYELVENIYNIDLKSMIYIEKNN